MATSQGRGITRNRERLACAECRRRKLRCDRHLPCSACVRRGDGQHCTYQRLASGTDRDRETQTRLESRLQHLEQLVHQVAPGSASSASSGPVSGQAASGDGDSNGGGPNISHRSTDIKNGSTHWSSVWEDIHELRVAMMDDKDDDLQPHAIGTEHTLVQGIGILFGSATHTTLKEILDTYLPPRQQLDHYVSAYFKAPAIAASFLHIPHFQRHYKAFWADPLSSSPLWVSILFSICHIAKNALCMGRWEGVRDGTFSAAAGHCLVVGEYFRPKRLALEALCRSALRHHVTDSKSDGLPPRSGHTRPSPLRSRGRLWSMLIQLDLLVSFHLGIPSSIQAPIDAVSPPRNLNSSDFGEDSIEIPPSRPLVESTEIQFCVAKHGFMAILDRILRHALRSQQSQISLDQVETLDAEIQSIYGDLPDQLKPRPMTESVFDPPNMVVTRLCILFIYCKSRCVLHRPYVLQRRPESIRACYDTASMLMRGFCDAYYEFTPEGQAKSDGWFIASLTWHDFLLGAVVLCMSSIIGKQSLAHQAVNVSEAVELLSQGGEICDFQGTNRGPETRKVHKIMNATIQHLHQYEASSVPETTDPMVPSAGNDGQMVPAENMNGGDDGPPMPVPMGDALWDEYFGQYLHLDLTGQDITMGRVNTTKRDAHN